jgi:tRNA-2-methylthio-N6-dimethylallyladenosine synthase
LLAAVAEIHGIRRVRFTTSHPRDFTRDIVAAIAAHPALCDHVHLPVQSGSSRVLRSMRREYTREQYLERVQWMKSAGCDISITTDIIVGFPGESEAEFEETLALLDEVGYDALFSFKYSPRPNTPALAYPDSIPDAEKSRRLAVLQQRQRDISTRRNHRHIGEKVEVMVEAYNEARRQWIGRTSQNKVLNFTAPAAAAAKLAAGEYVRVLVTASFPNSLAGELAD